VRRQLLLEKSGFGSRVPKYQQLFCNTQFGSLRFSPQETAIVCELLLRGPQTPGELRSRAARLAPFGDVSEVESALEALAARADEPCVAKLPREPGRRESRYRHLFGDTTGVPDEPFVETGRDAAAAPYGGGDEDSMLARIEALEAAVAALERRFEALGGGDPGQ
jgi:hypothetical protein